MSYFPPFRTSRLTVNLKEISISQSVKIASMPSKLIEVSCTEFLRCAIEKSENIPDPLDWTAQERMFAVSHYLACTSDGSPDFKIGNGNYSDYLDVSNGSFVESVNVGEVAGDHWATKNLTGRMLESIERLDGEIEGLSGRLYWMLGAMSAQLVMTNDDTPQPISDSEYDKWLLDRMRVFANFPDTQFESLMLLWLSASEGLKHLFSIQFDDFGVVVMPREGAEGNLPSARFPVRSCLSRLSLEMAG